MIAKDKDKDQNQDQEKDQVTVFRESSHALAAKAQNARDMKAEAPPTSILQPTIVVNVPRERCKDEPVEEQSAKKSKAVREVGLFCE